MNQDLVAEEIDRELIERVAKSPFFGEVIKIKVGKKVLTFESSFGDSISFDRRKDGLKITTKKIIKEGKTCSMGHWHETGQKINDYSFFFIDFEMIDKLKDWAELGAWVHPSRKK